MKMSNAEVQRRRRFDEVVAGFHAALFRYAAWLSRDPAIAEVVVQESLLRAWKSLDGLRDDAKAKQWLLTIVRRENARYFEGRERRRPERDAICPDEVADSGDAGIDEVREALLQLDDDYREPLVLQVLMGYSTSEIAELMGMKQGAVLTRLHRARMKLRKILEPPAAGELPGLHKGTRDAV